MVLPVSSIEAEVDAPDVVEVKPAQKYVRLTVRVTLRNSSDQTVVLHSPARDHEHFWHVFDENARELEREPGPGKGTKKAAPSPRTYRGLTLAPGSEWHETRNVRIAASKLRSGRYMLRSEYWGQPAETEFVAVVRPKPAKAAKKKAAKRKVAKKKAAPKKKAAKRKATKKKAAAKKKATKRKAAKKKAVPKKKATKRKAAKKKAAPKKKATKRKKAGKKARMKTAAKAIEQPASQ